MRIDNAFQRLFWTTVVLFHGLTAGANNSAWQDYLKSLPMARIQQNCKPTHFKPQGQPKGTVVLLHGFTACPQQFFELATQVLVPQGFEVYLPLLPGHGLLQKRGKDDHSEIPTAKNWEKKYGQLAQTIHRVMEQASPGLRGISGLSVGGALAEYTVQKRPELFDRALILVPLLRFSAPLLRRFNHLPEKYQPYARAATLNKMTRVPLSWGEGCFYERSQGRAGICDFTFGHLAGAAELGYETLTKATPRRTTLTQVVGVDGDQAADTPSARELANKLGAQFCMYPKPIGHSFLSRCDSPGENKFWMPHALQQIAAFFGEGQTYSQASGVCNLATNAEPLPVPTCAQANQMRSSAIDN